MNANMRAVIVEVTFRTVVAVPDELADSDGAGTLEFMAQEVARDNMSDILLAAERVPGLQVKTIKQAETAKEVLDVFHLTTDDSDGVYLAAPDGYDEPCLSEIFPEEVT